MLRSSATESKVRTTLQQNKQHQRKVLLIIFHLNDYNGVHNRFGGMRRGSNLLGGARESGYELKTTSGSEISSFKGLGCVCDFLQERAKHGR